MSWISVEDKKPVGSFWYLISSNGNVTMAFYEVDDDGIDYWLCHNDVIDKSEWDNVTHWQPLPEPPK